MKRNSLTFRTLLAFFAFSIVILSLLWFFQIYFFNMFYERYQIDTIKEAASLIANTNEEELNEKLESIAYEDDICIQYHVSFGKAINYNTKKNNCLLDNPTINVLGKHRKDLVENDKHFIKLQGPHGERSIVYAVNLEDGKLVLLNTTLEDLSAATKLLKNQMIYISIVIIVLAIVLAIFVSMQFNKPILSITNKAKEMGKGNYDVKFDKSRIAELDDLSNVLTVAASEMKETDELRRDLLANVSHDLKTPLTMIKAYAEKVRDLTYKDKEKRNKDLNVIIEESDRLNGLVNDLVEMSKIEANKATFEPTKYDIKEQVEEVMKRYSITQEKDGYKFNVNMPDKPLIIEADRKQMNQVFYNLINNAIEHTDDSKTVDINVKESKSIITVEVINYGKHLKEYEIPLVWNRYYTKEKNHKRNTIGTGIGLSIVKTIFENHKFEYGIISDEKHPTTFYFKVKKCKK